MNRTITQLVNLLRTFADELEGHCAEQVAAEAAATPAADKPKRGRPAKETPAAEPEKEPEKEKQADVSMTLEALQALIQPAVKAAAGKQVKDLIAKHGGTQLSNLPAANHAAFAEDVGALVY